MVQTNALTVTVGTDARSTLDRLVQLIWEIQASTPGVQQVADRLASLFVPLVLLLGAGAVGLQLYAGTTLPHALLRQWRAKHGAVAMVGDGGNDAPALADADLGVAFGPTALAAGSADVVILDDDLSRVPDVLSLAKATRRRIRQNLG